MIPSISRFRTSLPLLLAGLLCACPALHAAGGVVREFIFNHENVLGTSGELRVAVPSMEVARQAERTALAEIDRLAAIFSTYSADSEFSRWQRTRNEPVKVSPELLEVMSLSDTWRERTGGAFNPGAEVFTRLWREAAARGVPPSGAELAEAAAKIRSPAWRLDPVAGTATRLGDSPLSLDAIAKGYIVERAGEAALAALPPGAALVLNIGGDLRAWGSATHPVAITDPHRPAGNAAPIETVRLAAAALATSGDYRRGVTVAGTFHSHIVDARTGRPDGGVMSASVIAGDAALADVLATAFSILDPAESARIARTTPGVSFLLVTSGGETIRSAGWPVANTGLATAELTADTASEAGAENHELLIEFELKQPQNRGSYMRPYVAIWIEASGSRLLRTLLVWYDLQRWLPELRRWSRSEGRRTGMDPGNLTVLDSGVTRMPGRYSIVWDGLDHEKKPVPPGDYLLFIEVSREHGTYQLMRKVITVGGGPFQADLGSNEEVSAASIEYRRRQTGI